MTMGALGIGACGDDSEGASPDGMFVHLYGASGAHDPFTGVGWVRLVMSGDGMAAPYANLVPYAPGGSATLDAVPFSGPGQKRTLVVEGWADAGGQPGFVISRGRATPLEVRSGAEPQDLDVLMARVNSFLPLISSASKNPQQLAQGRVAHAVAHTAAEIVVMGGGTIAQPSSTWWTGAGFAQVIDTVEAIRLDTMEVEARPAMKLARAWHTASQLSSGQVIIAGGFGADGNPTGACELYNPPGVLEGRPLDLLPLAVPRAGHTATLLDEATRLILFVGGDAGGTWELWDPTNGSQGAQPLPDSLPRRHATATKFFLPNRSEPAVLVAGGETTTTVHSTAMLFDSVAKAMVPVSEAMPGGARTQHTAVWVPGRQFVYLAGGFTSVQRSGVTSAIDVFNIAERPPRFIAGNSGFRMRTARGGHDAVLLPDNVVVMVGGAGDEPAGTGIRPLGSLEVVHEFIDTVDFTLRIEVASSWNPTGVGQVPFLPADRLGHRTVALDSGMALVIGGATIDGGSGGFRLVRELSLYNPQ
ncbi:MAG: hypothetical protein IT385_15495 [Deltaproteobacteria bacterium]|nr:hypothetical protein [Deltaproteobacteria bacterium]